MPEVDFDAVFDALDLSRQGYLLPDQLQEFYLALYYEQVDIRHAKAAVSQICGPAAQDRCSKKHFVDVLMELDRRKCLEEKVYWDFQALDRDGSHRLHLNDALLLFRATHGEKFSFQTWNKFVASRVDPNDDVCFDEMKMWLCMLPEDGDPCGEEEAEKEEEDLINKRTEMDWEEREELLKLQEDDHTLAAEARQQQQYQAEFKYHGHRKLNRWNKGGVEAVIFDDGTDWGEDTQQRARDKVGVTELLAALDEKYRLLRERLLEEMAKVHIGEGNWLSLSESERQEQVLQVQLKADQLFQSKQFDQAPTLPGGGHPHDQNLRALMGEIYDDQKKRHEDQMEQTKRLMEEGKSDEEIFQVMENNYRDFISGSTTTGQLLSDLQQRYELEKATLLGKLQADGNVVLGVPERILALVYLMRQHRCARDEGGFDTALLATGIAERFQTYRAQRFDSDRSRQEQLATERLRQRKGRRQPQVPEEDHVKSGKGLGVVDLQLAVGREVTRKQAAERELLIQLVQGREATHAIKTARKMSQEQQEERLKELRRKRNQWRARGSEFKVTHRSAHHKILQEAAGLYWESRRDALGGRSVQDGVVSASVLADVQQKQDMEWTNALLGMQGKSAKELNHQRKQEQRACREEWLDQLSAVVLGTFELTDQEKVLYTAVEEKYDALREKLFVVSILTNTSLPEEERQHELARMKAKEQNLRREANTEDMAELLGQHFKTPPGIMKLMGELRLAFEKRVFRHLKDTGKTAADLEDNFDLEEPACPEMSANPLAELHERFEEEIELILTLLHDSQDSHEAIYQSELVWQRREKHRVEKEGMFIPAALIVGLAERLRAWTNARSVADKARYQSVAEERMAHYAYEKTNLQEELNADDRRDPSEGDVIGWQQAVLRALDNKHLAERHLLLGLLGDETSEELREVAAEMDSDERRKRLVEVKMKKRKFDLESEASRDENFSVLEEAAALKSVARKFCLENKHPAREITHRYVTTTLLADLHEEQDLEAQAVFATLASKSEAELRRLREQQTKLRQWNAGDNVLIILTRFEDSGGSDLMRILQRKHEKERAFLSKLLQDRGRQDLWDAATVMSSVQKQERLLELTTALRTAERGKAGTGEYRKVLQEAAIVKFQSRKSSLEKEKGVGVSNDDVVVSVLKDLYHEQDKDQKNVIEQSSVMGEPTLAGVQKQCLELLKQGRSENVSIVVLAAEVTKEAGQEELIDALEGKYDALRDKLIAEALAKQMGEAEWSLLSEQERQARLIKMKLEQRKLRQEGRQEEADAILAQLLKDQQNLESLMGDTRAEQERKLKERLARRKKRLEEGMTEEEAERLEQEEIQEEEEEKRKQLSANILADLEKRYEEEKEALLASLKSADAQVDSERKRQAELTRLRLEQRRARQEDNFEAAAIVMGLAQSSEAAKEKERARQEQLARERLEERRRKRKEGHGKVEPTEEAVPVPEDEEDTLAWQEAVVREMEKKHTEERNKLVELLQTEGASGSSGRQKAQAVTEQDRQDRLFELSEIRRDWREQSSAELSETQDEQEEIFEESTALRVECCLVALQSAAEGKSLSDDDVHVSLLADLQQHQDKESHYLLQDLATKTIATLKQVKMVQYRARADRWCDNVAAVLLTGGRPKSPEEGGSEGELVKALEDKYDALRDKLIMQALIDTMGEAEWAALSEKERQARLVKMKLQERRLRQQGKFDEAAALLGEGIKNQEELARLLGEARTDQKKQLEEKLARRRQLKAEREAQGLATDDATLDEIQEEEEKKNLPKNILAELQNNFEAEKEALLASLRNQDERFASERNRQLELARLRREQKRLNQEDKFDSAAIVFSIARRNEAAKEANVEKDRERQKQLAQERLAARKKKKQEQADLTNREALEERLRQEEEDQRLEEEEERSKMTDEGAVGLQVAVLSELEKKHSAERDVLMQLVQAAEGNQAGRAEVNKMADEELTSNLESLRQQRQAWRQKVAEGEEVTDVSERAKVQSEQNHFLGQAVLIAMEGKCRELTPQLEGKTPEEVTAEAAVLLLAELQQKQEAEGNALNSVLSGSLEEDLLKSLKDDQRRARREGWLDNLAAVVLGLTKDAQDRPGTTDSTGSREEKAISGQEEKQLQDLDDELEQQKQELIKKGQLGEDIDVEEAMAELEKQYKAKREALSSDMARQRAQLKKRLAARKAKRENQMYEEDMAAAMIQRASQQAAQLSQMAEADKAKHGDKLQERLAARREARRLAAEAKKKEEEDQKRKKSEKGALPPGFSMKREKTVINVDLSKEKQDEILESLRSDKDKADKKLQRDKERISLQVQAKLEQRKRTRVSAAQEVFTLGERQKTILEKTQHEDRERQMTIVKERIQKVKYERTMTIKARQRASQAKFEEMLTTQDVQQLSRDEKMNRAAEEMMRKFRTDEEDVKKGMKSVTSLLRLSSVDSDTDTVAFALDDSADSDSVNSGAEEGVSASEQVRPKTRGRMTDEEKRKLMKERFEKRKERKRTQEGTHE
ncbi:trichohyalin-like isoform X2 [Branchiostoma lanceolatum]|uniref:trichohyalin-like isoform X2 n=1 Tax=Branchiostoma lanceolatum TaxID=7740 RepID=UPI003456A0F5